MTAQTRKSIFALFLVIGVISFVEMFGIPGADLTKAQSITVGLMIIAAVLWVSEWVPLFVVSFLILAFELIWLYPVLHSQDMLSSVNVFYGSFFSNIILLFLGGFVLSALMQKYGLDIQFAQAILRRTGGNASLTLLGIILASAFLSMWVSNTATTAMMLTIVFPLLKTIPGEHPFKIALVLSIPFACNIGGIGTPIGTPPNAIALSYLNNLHINVSFGLWMLLALPFLVIFLAFLWRLLLWLYPAKGLVLDLETRTPLKFSARPMAALAIFLFTAVAWLFGGSIGLKSGTIALFPVIVSFWFGLLDTADFRKLPWDILYIIAGGLALGVALDTSGLGKVIVEALPQNTATILVLGLVITMAMSTVMSNTATAGLMIPLVTSLQVEQTFLLTLVVGIAMSCSMAMALPVTTPPNAIAFSSRVIRSKDMLLAGGIISLFSIAVLLLMGKWYWTLILTH